MSIVMWIVIGWLSVGVVVAAWGFSLSAPWRHGMPVKEMLWRYPLGVILWPFILLTIIAGE